VAKSTKEPLYLSLSRSLSLSPQVFGEAVLRFRDIPRSLGRIFRKQRFLLLPADNVSDVVNPAFFPGRGTEMAINSESRASDGERVKAASFVPSEF